MYPKPSTIFTTLFEAQKAVLNDEILTEDQIDESDELFMDYKD
jgi:hypothetical protein